MNGLTATGRLGAGRAIATLRLELAYVLPAFAAVFLLGTVPWPGVKVILTEGIGLSACLAILAGIRRNRPAPATAWYVFAGAQIAFMAADALWFARIGGDPLRLPITGPFDAVYLGAYGLCLAAVIFLISGDRGHARGEVIDGAIVAAGLGLVVWELYVEPSSAGPGHSIVEQMVTLGYATLIVLGTTFLTRLGFARRAKLPAFWLLVASQLCVLAAYGTYSSRSTYGFGGTPDALWATAYVLRGAAALHPSMRRLADPGLQPTAGLTRGRLLLFGAAVLVAPVLLAVMPTYEGKDVVVYAGCGTVAVLLVLLRMAGLVHAVEAKATELESQSDHLRATVDQLRASEQQRQVLSARVASAQEEERRRIASDIHDDPVQAITAIGIRLQTFRRAIEDPEKLKLLAKLEESVERTTARLRNLMFELYPATLEQGLARTIQESLRRVGNETEIHTSLVTRLDGEPNDATRTALFRIVQESLANVRKHAEASKVEVTLETQDGGTRIVVRDNGRGFEVGDALPIEPGHLGLFGMQQRAEGLGGWLRVDSVPSVGTSVESWIPTEAPEGVT